MIAASASRARHRNLWLRRATVAAVAVAATVIALASVSRSATRAWIVTAQKKSSSRPLRSSAVSLQTRRARNRQLSLVTRHGTKKIAGKSDEDLFESSITDTMGAWFKSFGQAFNPMGDKERVFLFQRLQYLIPKHLKYYTVLDFAPKDEKMLLYLTADKGKDKARVEKYIVFGAVDQYEDDTITQLKISGGAGKIPLHFVDWKAGEAPTMAKAILPESFQVTRELRKGSQYKMQGKVDFALFSSGTWERHRGSVINAALAEVSKALTSDGKLVLIVSEEDEKYLGKLEDILESLDRHLPQSLETPAAASMEQMLEAAKAVDENAPGRVLLNNRLRLLGIAREEGCAVAIGACIRLPKAPQARRMDAEKKAARKRPSGAGFSKKT